MQWSGKIMNMKHECGFLWTLFWSFAGSLLWLLTWEAWSRGKNGAQTSSPSTSSCNGKCDRHKPVLETDGEWIKVDIHFSDVHVQHSFRVVKYKIIHLHDSLQRIMILNESVKNIVNASQIVSNSTYICHILLIDGKRLNWRQQRITFSPFATYVTTWWGLAVKEYLSE